MLACRAGLVTSSLVDSVDNSRRERERGRERAKRTDTPQKPATSSSVTRIPSGTGDCSEVRRGEGYQQEIPRATDC